MAYYPQDTVRSAIGYVLNFPYMERALTLVENIETEIVDEGATDAYQIADAVVPVGTQELALTWAAVPAAWNAAQNDGRTMSYLSAESAMRMDLYTAALHAARVGIDFHDSQQTEGKEQRMAKSTRQLKVGNSITVTIDGRPYDMTVCAISPAGSMGRARTSGPRVHARLDKGSGYTVSFDDSTTHITWQRKDQT